MENFENEEWRDVSGSNGKYEVSNMGRIRSTFPVRNSPSTTRFLKPIKSGNYLAAGLHLTPGKLTWIKVHRLVMITFCPIDNPKEMQVDHINFDTRDNRICNLRWVTPSENTRHSLNNGRWENTIIKPFRDRVTGENNVFTKLKDEDIGVIREMRRNGASLKEIAKIYGMKEQGLGNICYGKNWKHLNEKYPPVPRRSVIVPNGRKKNI